MLNIVAFYGDAHLTEICFKSEDGILLLASLLHQIQSLRS